MSAFAGLGTSLLGTGLGLAGSVIGGDAQGREARRAREATRDTNRKNASTQIGLLNAILQGSGGTTGGFEDQIAQLQAMLSDPNLKTGQRKKAFKSLLKFQERNRAAGAPGIETGGLPELRKQLDTEQAGQLSEFDKVFGQQGTARTSLASLLDATRPFAADLLTTADAFGPAARNAANMAVDRQVAEGLAGARRTSKARGLARNPGGSSDVDSAATAIRSDAGAGLARALADIEAQSTGFRTNALQQRLGLERDIAGQLGGFDVGAAGQRFGIGNNFSNQRLNTYQYPLGLIAGMASPGALVSQPLPQGGDTTGQNIGNALSGIGGQVAGFGLAGTLNRLLGVK